MKNRKPILYLLIGIVLMLILYLFFRDDFVPTLKNIIVYGVIGLTGVLITVILNQVISSKDRE
ncbi:hypothetical protein [Membranihabitans maritimus]|uniref:hypothetical protein n=1 Tax=Membranihabitans maritimus TaxID=2904244 RepID=UPI001F395ABB|nr:hypothetical protein [Membranihabitans maritimus]